MSNFSKILLGSFCITHAASAYGQKDLVKYVNTLQGTNSSFEPVAIPTQLRHCHLQCKPGRHKQAGTVMAGNTSTSGTQFADFSKRTSAAPGQTTTRFFH